MFISILTKTASYTYEETMTGYKGWFESGNSIGTIMLLLLCVVLPMLSKKYEAKYRIWTLMITILTGVYLSTLLGTRVGLFGFLFVIFENGRMSIPPYDFINLVYVIYSFIYFAGNAIKRISRNF